MTLTSHRFSKQYPAEDGEAYGALQSGLGRAARGVGQNLARGAGMTMKLWLTALAVVLSLSGASAVAQTLEAIQERNVLRCGVNTSLKGFSELNEETRRYEGFDADFCRAVAAATLGDAEAIEFVELTATDRFDALLDGEIDVLSRSTTWTYERDTGGMLDFAGIIYYDGQGFLVPRDLGVTSARDLNGRTVCLHANTTSEANVEDFFAQNDMSFDAVPADTPEQAREQYLAGACDVYTADASALAAARAALPDGSEHVLLPEIVSKEPLSPVVLQGDPQWADVVRWTLNALVAAEELGVTSANVDEIAESSENSEVRRLLGGEGGFGAMLGLQNDWARSAISAVGNYGEIFERNIGENTPIGIARGLNAQWSDGGLLYALPFR